MRRAPRPRDGRRPEIFRPPQASKSSLKASGPGRDRAATDHLRNRRVQCGRSTAERGGCRKAMVHLHQAARSRLSLTGNLRAPRHDRPRPFGGGVQADFRSRVRPPAPRDAQERGRGRSEARRQSAAARRGAAVNDTFLSFDDEDGDAAREARIEALTAEILANAKKKSEAEALAKAGSVGAADIRVRPTYLNPHNSQKPFNGKPAGPRPDTPTRLRSTDRSE